MLRAQRDVDWRAGFVDVVLRSEAADFRKRPTETHSGPRLKTPTDAVSNSTHAPSSASRDFWPVVIQSELS